MRRSTESDTSCLRVLVADDRDNCERVRFLLDDCLCDCLDNCDIAVSVERTGSRVVDRVLNEEFDVIFLADDLPVLSGLDVLTFLREQRVAAPIVMMTDSELTSDLRKYIDAGSIATMTRPVEVEQLFAILSEVAFTSGTAADAKNSWASGRGAVLHIEKGVRATLKACEFRDASRVSLLVEKLRGVIDVSGYSDFDESAEQLELCVRELANVHGEVAVNDESYDQITATLQQIQNMVAELQTGHQVDSQSRLQVEPRAQAGLQR